MKRIMLTVSNEMWEELEKERTTRRYKTIQEVVRHIIADHLHRGSISPPRE